MHNPRRRVNADHARLALRAMAAAGHTQRTLAAATGLALTSIQRIHSGEAVRCEAQAATSIIWHWMFLAMCAKEAA